MSGAIDVSAVMVGLAAAIQPELASGRTAYDRPVEAVKVGDALVGYPQEPIAISGTFRRGMDRGTFPVFVICGYPHEVDTREAVAGWIGSGSIVAAIEAYAGTWQSVSVTTVQVDQFTPLGGSPLLALRFDVDVIS